MNTNTNRTNTVTVTIIRDRHGDEHCHAAGCADLKPSKYRLSEGFTIEADSRDDVTYEVWGASGVASDNYPGEIYDEGYRAYTIENYDGLIRIFPCVRFGR